MAPTVGPLGLLQPIADALKLLTKEIIQPTAASKGFVCSGARDGDHASVGGLGRNSLHP